MVKKLIKKFNFTKEKVEETDGLDLAIFDNNFRNGATVIFDNNGINIENGDIRSLGTVRWNQELQRLEFWNGLTWQQITITDIS